MSPLEDTKSTAFNEDVLIYVGEEIRLKTI